MPKRSILGELKTCTDWWMDLRKYPGLFTISDASLGLKDIALPRRFVVKDLGRRLERETEIRQLEPSVSLVRIKNNGLVFYWLENVTPNLYYTIKQEFDPRCPHFYTTPPVELTPDSLVLDVGACEGLFAYRVLQAGQAKRIICFEPSRRTAHFTRKAAAENGFERQITVEELAVGKRSGPVRFVQSASATANRVEEINGATQSEKDVIQCTSLDDYCVANKIKPGPRDLIKIDAEGFDFDILLGAEQLIRDGSPQISVTTYHKDSHVDEIVNYLRGLQPKYKLRLKGFSYWTDRPRPVLLQAAL
jgi:FkbM family methyltransferase